MQNLVSRAHIHTPKQGTQAPAHMSILSIIQSLIYMQLKMGSKQRLEMDEDSSTVHSEPWPKAQNTAASLHLASSKRWREEQHLPPVISLGGLFKHVAFEFTTSAPQLADDVNLQDCQSFLHQRGGRRVWLLWAQLTHRIKPHNLKWPQSTWQYHVCS